MSDFVGLLPLRHYDKVIKLIVTFHINDHWDELTGVVVESTCSNEHAQAWVQHQLAAVREIWTRFKALDAH
jgi:hypothetical protein